MTVEWEIAREKREAREEGLAEGRAAGREAGLAEGRAEGNKEKLLQLIRTKLGKKKTPEQIADEIEMPLDETLALINSLS